MKKARKAVDKELLTDHREYSIWLSRARNTAEGTDTNVPAPLCWQNRLSSDKFLCFCL